jgi:hypothetical protein
LSVTNTLLTQQQFADDAARAVAVPDYQGQLGGQTDGTAWVSHALVAGDWTQILTAGSNLPLEEGVEFNLDGAGNIWNFITSDGTGEINIQGAGMSVLFSGADVRFNGGTFAFSSAPVWSIEGVDIPSNSVLITGSSTGVLDSSLISTFLSTANVSTGWSGFTNSAVLKTGDCNTITLPQLAQVVDTLINVLKTVILPAT